MKQLFFEIKSEKEGREKTETFIPNRNLFNKDTEFSIISPTFGIKGKKTNKPRKQNKKGRKRL